jgi:hypothetical protein
MRDTCAKGIDVRAHVGGPALSWGIRKPCSGHNKEAVPCALYEKHTPAEVADHEREMRRAIERIHLLGPLLSKIKTVHDGMNWSGVEECPACKGRLHMAHVGFNGHTHGKCETEGCLAWME